MKVETIAVGGPRTLAWQDREVVTSIFKSPVTGPVVARAHNLDGDRQSDLQVHGGEFKAVYAYAAEHYGWWRTRLGRELEPANFGENLTISGLFKLGIRFGDASMVKAFADSRRWGIYFRIAKEGRIAPSDAVTVIHRDPARLPVYEIARVYLLDREDDATMQHLAAHERIVPAWREWFLKRLSDSGKEKASAGRFG